MAFDAKRFMAALQEESDVPSGIGTLSEKRLHAALKRYYAPELSHREVPVGRYIADVFDGERIVEIQTHNFAYLRSKLKLFLPLYPVTLVYPLPRVRYLIWTDPATGESSRPHKGRRQETPLSALHELYAISAFLKEENLTIELLLFDLDEYRLLDGYGKSRKRYASLVERIPRGAPERMVLRTTEDYRALLPEGLPARFKVSELQKKAGIYSRAAYSAVHVMETLGILAQDGKEGRATVYRLTDGV